MSRERAIAFLTGFGLTNRLLNRLGGMAVSKAVNTSPDSITGEIIENSFSCIRVWSNSGDSSQFTLFRS